MTASSLIIIGKHSDMSVDRVRRKSVCKQLETILFLIFLSFPLLFGSWLLITLPDRYQAEVNFRSKALLTSGIVVEIKRSTTCYLTGGLGANCTSHCDAAIQFTSHQGRVIQFWDDCIWLSVQKHQIVPVLYDPTVLDRHQIKARIDRGDSPESRARNDLIASLLLVLFGLISLFTVFSSYRIEQKRP